VLSFLAAPLVPGVFDVCPDDPLDCVARVEVTAACVPPGRLNASAPAAIMLAAVALTAAARSRARPRSRAATDPARS